MPSTVSLLLQLFIKILRIDLAFVFVCDIDLTSGETDLNYYITVHAHTQCASKPQPHTTTRIIIIYVCIIQMEKSDKSNPWLVRKGRRWKKCV